MNHEADKLAIYLTNLGKYNEGELIGKWVTLPTDSELLEKAFQQIEIGEEYEEYFISDYESPLGIKVGEYENLDELNYLAHKLEDMNTKDLEKYEAILEIESVSSINEYINLTENIDCYDIIPDVASKSELGQYVMEEMNGEILQQMMSFSTYFDYDQYGHDIDIEWGGSFVNDNYIYANGESAIEIYNGKRNDIPLDYIVTNSKIDEKKSIKEKLVDNQNKVKEISKSMSNEKNHIEL